ncbi:MAG: SPASM domain-containing protein, partial [Caldisphaera sp.]|nr:SPASM domain-containing protein [Caldisphaera sp.]
KKGLSNYYSCPAGRSRFIIDSNGDIYGCELLINRKFLEGNVRKNRIEDIWINGFKQFREDRWKKINYCSTCEISSLCQGGCVARAFNGENIYNKDPLCNFNVEHL